MCCTPRCVCFLFLCLVVSSPGRADTLLFQEGAFAYSNTTDTWLQGASGSADHDGATVLEWDGADAGAENFMLLRFDEVFGTQPGQIQPTDVITSATLTYQVINPGDPASVNEVTVDWSPPSPTTFDSFGGDPGVQSDEYGGLVATAPGGLGSHDIDVTSSIAAWAVNPALNRGWVFRPTGGANGVEVRSGEAAPSKIRSSVVKVRATAR